MSNRIDKRVWGVLGKQQTYYSPLKALEGKTKVPLNANSFESWDSKKSRYYRVDGVPNHIQQHGVVPQDAITPTPSPSPSPTITVTPTNTNTPSITCSVTPTITETITPTPSCTVTTQYLEVELQSCHTFTLTLWNNPNFTGSANAVCDVIVSGCAYGDQGTIYCGEETILATQHIHTFNLNPVLQPGECVSAFTVNSIAEQCDCYNVIYNFLTPTPTSTVTNTPTSSETPTNTPTVTQTPSATASGMDPNAEAYLNEVVASGGTVDATIENAVNDLFVNLKNAGLYNKIIAFYPYVGATSASHSIEAKLQTDKYITFNGGWTHSVSGATPNGSNGWATNNLICSTALTQDNASIWSYLGTDNNFQGDYCIDFGSTNNLGVNGLCQLIGGPSQPDTNSYWYNNDGSATRIVVGTGVIPNGIGSFGNNRTSSTVFNIWRNGTKVATDNDTNTGSLPSTNPYFMPAPGNNSIDYVNKYSERRHQFDCIAEGLSDSEAGDLMTYINTFQAALSRNVY